MTRTVQQLIASYVALCLAFAGAVGISPALHQWVEHGGQGDAHIHVGGQAGGTTPAHRHEHDAEHRHEPGQVHNHRPAEPLVQIGFFVHTVQSFQTPEIFSQIWRFIAGILDPSVSAGPDSSPAPDQNDHEHHSLAQLVASGLVELSIDLAPLDAAFLPIIFGSFPPDALFLAGGWNAQTASRGPPAAG